jgi:hypothetical protein
MKTLKFCLFFAFFAIVANSAHARNLTVPKKSESAQIQSMLKNIEFEKFVSKETKISISFFINGQNEVIVVSTNNKELDSVIKSTLNYSKIAVEELEYNKVYTIPVVIK